MLANLTTRRAAGHTCAVDTGVPRGQSAFGTPPSFPQMHFQPLCHSCSIAAGGVQCALRVPRCAARVATAGGLSAILSLCPCSLYILPLTAYYCPRGSFRAHVLDITDAAASCAALGGQEGGEKPSLPCKLWWPANVRPKSGEHHHVPQLPADLARDRPGRGAAAVCAQSLFQRGASDGESGAACVSRESAGRGPPPCASYRCYRCG